MIQTYRMFWFSLGLHSGPPWLPSVSFPLTSEGFQKIESDTYKRSIIKKFQYVDMSQTVVVKEEDYQEYNGHQFMKVREPVIYPTHFGLTKRQACNTLQMSDYNRNKWIRQQKSNGWYYFHLSLRDHHSLRSIVITDDFLESIMVHLL